MTTDENLKSNNNTFIIKAKADTNCAMIPHATILDSRMSCAALGLINYLLMRTTRPEGWSFHTKEIKQHFAGATRNETRSSLKELKTLGYLKRIQPRNKNGGFAQSVWIISAVPTFSGSDKDGDEKTLPT